MTKKRDQSKTRQDQRSSAPRSSNKQGVTGDGRILYGLGPVEEAVAAGTKLRAIWVSKDSTHPRIGSIVAKVQSKGTSVNTVSKDALQEIARSEHHQGIVCEATPFVYTPWKDICTPSPQKTDTVVVLDSVEDPRNVGAIVRSAYLFGAKAVVLPERRAAGVTATVTKTSAGATERIAICQVNNLRRAIDQLKQNGFWVAGLDGDAEDGVATTTLPKMDTSGPLCWVVGGEGKGLRPLVKKSCDFMVRIPMMQTHVGSFNVAVAVSLALYETRRSPG